MRENQSGQKGSIQLLLLATTILLLCECHLADVFDDLVGMLRPLLHELLVVITVLGVSCC